MRTQLIMALSSAYMIIVAAAFAHSDGTLLPKQMMVKYPIGFSFSFVANGAMWGNLIFMSLALYIIGKYASGWSTGEMLLSFGVGMVISLAMFYFVYLQGKFPDSLAGGGRPISPAGWVIVLYFGAVLAAIGLFYFFSHPTTTDVVLVGILLALYIVVANHVPLDLLNRSYYFPWCPDIFVEERTPLLIIAGSGALLTAVTAVKLW